MTNLFRARSLALRLRMSPMTPALGVMTGLLAGFTLPAQAQGLASQNQLVITNVEVDYAQGQMFIHGRNFSTLTGVPPTVHLKEIGVNVKTYGPSTIVVTLPPSVQQPGNYLLTMSSGPNLEQNDSFNVTLGAVGPKGPKGEPGIPGLKGNKGDQGDQGIKGNQGDQGIKGLQGDQGIPGLKGDQGDQGIKGPPGAPGYTGPLSCRIVAGASVNEYVFPGSYAGCASGEFLTGGACSSNTTAIGTASNVTSVSGIRVFGCALRGTTSTTAKATAEAICCKVP